MFSLPIRWTIGRKLQLLVLITLLPAFIISGSLALADQYQTQREAIRERAAHQASHVADEVDNIVLSAEQSLATIAEVPAIQTQDGQGAVSLLSRLLPEYHRYDNLIALDADGRAYAMARPVGMGLFFAGNSQYFRTALATGKPSVGTIIPEDGSEPVLVIAYPVQDLRMAKRGVVAATIKSSALRSVIARDAAADAAVTVVTLDGEVLARSPDPEDWLGRRLPLERINPNITAKTAGVWLGSFADDTSRLLAFDAPLNAPWRVVVGIPADEANQAITSIVARGGLVFGVVFGFAVAIAIVLSRRLTAPLRRLVSAAQEFGDEQLPVPVPIEGRDEVAELGIAFNKMLADLQRHIDELSKLQAVRETDRLKTMLLTSVSHELKTPLGSIKGFASALQQDDVALDRATQLDFLATIETNADRLTRLVEDILDMSRIETGALRLEYEPCSVVELLQATLPRVQHLLENRTVHFSLPADLPPVLVDPERIERVLFNLLDNAIKYSADSTSITARAWSASTQSANNYHPAPCPVPDESVVIAVDDEGIGVPPEDLERIFDRFWRAEPARRRHATGTGLGLAICQGIIRMHGGRIWAETRPTAGTRIVFTVPVARDNTGVQMAVTVATILGRAPSKAPSKSPQGSANG